MIYIKLTRNEMRDKIIKGELEEEDYKYKEVHKFLQLLTRDRDSIETSNYEEISTIK